MKPYKARSNTLSNEVHHEAQEKTSPVARDSRIMSYRIGAVYFYMCEVLPFVSHGQKEEINDSNALSDGAMNFIASSNMESY